MCEMKSSNLWVSKMRQNTSTFRIKITRRPDCPGDHLISRRYSRALLVCICKTVCMQGQAKIKKNILPCSIGITRDNLPLPYITCLFPNLLNFFLVSWKLCFEKVPRNFLLTYSPAIRYPLVPEKSVKSKQVICPK